jgi:hypothetical protein
MMFVARRLGRRSVYTVRSSPPGRHSAIAGYQRIDCEHDLDRVVLVDGTIPSLRPSATKPPSHRYQSGVPLQREDAALTFDAGLFEDIGRYV